MKKRSDAPEDYDSLREKLIGLGERSVRKSYYPKLQEQLHELERTKDELKQLTRQLQLILETAGEGIFGLDLDGNYTFMNKAAAGILGYKQGELTGRHSHSCIHDLRPDGTPSPEQECRTCAAFRDGITRHVDNECFCRKDGTRFPVEYTCTPIRENGEITGAVVTFRDITERKRAEARLKESESNLRTILDSVYDAIFIHDPDGSVIDVNNKMLELYRVSREQALRFRIIEDFSAPDNPFEKVRAIWKKVLAGENHLFEWKAKRPDDGSVFDVEVFLTKIALASREAILASVRDITERKKSEELKARVSAIVETAEDAIISENLDGIIQTWNKGAERIYGYSAAETEGKSVSLFIPPDKIGEHEQMINIISRGEYIEHFETERIRKDGTRFHVSLSVSPIKDEIGGIRGAASIAHDITERVRTEEALKLTQFSVDHASVSAFIVARDSRFIYVNHEASRELGYTREELLSLSVSDIDPDFPTGVWDAHWDQLKREGSIHFETMQRKKDGTLLPVDLTLNFVAFGGREYNVAFSLDISERKRAEQELVKMNRQKDLILESAGDGIFGMDEQGYQILANSAGARMLGYRTDELLGRYSHSQWHHSRPDGTPYPADECKIYRTRNDGISRHVEDEVFWKKDGSSIPVEYVTTPIREGDAIVGTVVSFRDITERKRSEEALRISESRFRNLFKQSALSMQILSPEGGTLEVNHAFEDLWGVRPGMLKDYNILEDRQLSEKGIMPYIKRGFAGEAAEIPIVRYDPSEIDSAGRPRWVKAFIYPVKTGAGSIHQVVLMHWDVTEMVAAQEALRESEKRFRAFFELAAVGAVEADPFTGRFLRMNDRFCRITGYSRAELLSRTFSELTHPDDRILDVRFFEGVRKGELGEFTAEKRYIHRDGRTIWGHVSVTVIRDSSGRPVRTAAIIQDITARKHAEDALRRSEEFLRRVLDNLIAFVGVLTRDGVLIQVNRSALEAAGIGPGDVLGKKFEETYWFTWSPDAQAMIRNAIQKGLSGEMSRFDMEILIADGSRMPIDFMLAPIMDGQGRITHLLPSAIDISSRKKMEEEIKQMAHHDPLTGLPNRRLFRDITDLELADARRTGKKLAVLFLDLDRFKQINDTLGHEAGDSLLKHVAERIRKTIRTSDSVARIGGDEFNIILSDIARADDISETCRKILDSLRQAFVLGPRSLHVTGSIGISIFPDDGTDPEELLRFADIAMYHAKESGRNAFRFYNPSIDVSSLERMKLETRLRQSISRNELIVHYQPQINITSGKMECAEALVRWNHPERGLLAPGEFIPLAEETGFISAVDEWVLRTVCRQVRAWKEEGIDSFCVTVNLSTRQFQSPELARMIKAVIRETGMAPAGLDIEITESLAMKDVERSASQLRKLTEMGVHVSVDDFGTGYSSLNYLKKLPIERIKIDKSFIRDIATDSDDRTIINAVTSMAHKMGIRTVAEGVETEEQFSFLRQSECDEAQGFLFGRPMPAEQFRELIRTGRQRSTG